MFRAKLMEFKFKWCVLLTILAFTLVLVNCGDSNSLNGPYNMGVLVPSLRVCHLCHTNHPRSQATTRGDPYRRSGPGLRACCGGAVTDYFHMDQFENMFSNRNSLEVEANAKGKSFWDYDSFITASAQYQPYGFGTTYMNQKFMGTKEVAAFLAHVATKTSCEHKVASREQLARGLCNNKEINSNLYNYCDQRYKDTYPCAPGIAYYGRGALPIYWNYNYGEAGKDLKVDLLNHPEYIEQNATLAFQVAIWRWMTPIKKHQPSAHNVFIGYWTPTKNDTLAKRVSGFGATMNVLYGDLICGQDDNKSMNKIISHYLYYLDLMGVGREEAGPHEVLSCAKQVAFNPSISSSP